MTLSVGGALALTCLLAVGGCGGDDKPVSSPDVAAGAGGSATEASNGDGGTAAATPGDACQVGCQATLAANCSNGPTDQTNCESACAALAAGTCGGEYATFQACAEGQAITCSPQGQPIVAACSDEQAAFVVCING